MFHGFHVATICYNRTIVSWIRDDPTFSYGRLLDQHLLCGQYHGPVFEASIFFNTDLGNKNQKKNRWKLEENLKMAWMGFLSKYHVTCIIYLRLFVDFCWVNVGINMYIYLEPK